MSNKKFILITGASSDLGRACAISLSKNHAIIISGRDLDSLKTIKKELYNSNKNLIWVCDLLDDNIVENLTHFIKKNCIEIKSFIHFAGLFNVKPIRLIKSDEIEKSFRINVLSAIKIVSVLSKKIHRKNLSDIIFISSISTLRGKSGFSLYASAKSALSGLTKNLSIELAPINVNQLIVGPVLTKKTSSLLSPLKQTLDDHIPLKIGSVSQIVDWIDFLINNKNKWATGQEFIIDGGASVL